jgi:AhpD family alkylhydroperoxidase
MTTDDFRGRRDQIQEQLDQLGAELPGTMRGFGELHREALAGGALHCRVKELIALGIAISVRCDGCIAYHVHDALAAGASRQEILETIGVAVLMGGGPSAVYGADARRALEEFASESASV